jgi:hypothetical protein
MIGRLVTGLVVDRLSHRLVSSATLVIQVAGLTMPGPSIGPDVGLQRDFREPSPGRNARVGSFFRRHPGRQPDNGPAVLRPARVDRLVAHRALAPIRGDNQAVGVDTAAHQILADRVRSVLGPRIASLVPIDFPELEPFGPRVTCAVALAQREDPACESWPSPGAGAVFSLICTPASVPCVDNVRSSNELATRQLQTFACRLDTRGSAGLL